VSVDRKRSAVPFPLDFTPVIWFSLQPMGQQLRIRVKRAARKRYHKNKKAAAKTAKASKAAKAPKA
jgi:hypothetical protein